MASQALSIQSLTNELKKQHFLQICNSSHLNADDFIAKVHFAVSQSARLQKCTEQSLVTVCITSAQYGLPIDSRRFAYIIPTWDEDKKAYIATFQIGYLGLLQLAYRSGVVSRITLDAVFNSDKDIKKYKRDGVFHLDYEPDMSINREVLENLQFVASFIYFRDGAFDSEFLSKDSLNYITDKTAKNKKTGELTKAWKDWPVEMAKKTVLKRMLKRYSYISAELAQAIAEDDKIYKDKDDEQTIKDAEVVQEQIITTEQKVQDILKQLIKISSDNKQLVEFLSKIKNYQFLMQQANTETKIKAYIHDSYLNFIKKDNANDKMLVLKKKQVQKLFESDADDGTVATREQITQTEQLLQELINKNKDDDVWQKINVVATAEAFDKKELPFAELGLQKAVIALITRKKTQEASEFKEDKYFNTVTNNTVCDK